ncbi:MAG: MBL fold metallo-hydrolase [Oscillospiraceae bacterium]|nr:MBL fold metallo-hydrolase [Oscillospiraceae bacterium]
MFQATILIDNNAENGFHAEWGFCVYIHYNGKRFLLDTGASDRYLANAKQMSIHIEDVDYAVLSHAHGDHSGGFHSFFETNRHAPLYVSDQCREDCYFKLGLFPRYIGIPKGILNQYQERIVPVHGLLQLEEGVWLVPHRHDELDYLGKRGHLYRKQGRKLLPDCFPHEQSLVFETSRGLAIFNSCSHVGLETIVEDVRRCLPGKKVLMTVGGLHLVGLSTQEVREIAQSIKQTGIEHVLTGHCTGSKAMEILREELGETVKETYSGLIIKVRESAAV